MKRIFLIALVFIACVFSTLAQAPLSFHNVQIPGTGSAYCMEKDDEGLLWIGTGDGLYCYDGYRCYHRVDNSSVTPYGIQTLIIIGDEIYLGCDNGFFCYNRKSNSFECLISNIREVNATLSYGDIIFIGCKEGLWTWDKNKKEARRVIDNVKSIYSIAEYGENLLIGAINGLYLVKDGKAFKRSCSGYVGVIMPDVHKNFFWIGGEGSLYYYNAITDSSQHINELGENYVKSVAIDDDNNIYFGTDNGLFVKKDKSFNLFKHDSSDPSSLQNNIICDLYIDNLKNIWIGNNVGFSMIPKESVCEILSIEKLTGKNDGNLIHAISLDKDENLWLGGTDGLVRCGKNDVNWYKPSSSDFPILHNRVRDIYNDADGDLWILTDHGINLFDRNTKQLVNFIVENNDGQYNSSWAYDIFLDKQRNLWIGAFNEGVFVINKDKLITSKGKIKADLFYGKSNDKLAGEHVYHITPDKEERVWVSSNGGIDRIDFQTLTVTHISDDSATSMISDSKGQVWISFENGIRCYKSNGDIIYEIYFAYNDNIVRFIKILEIDNLIWAITQEDCRIIHPDGHMDIFSLPDINIQTAYYSQTEQKLLLGGMDKVAYIDCRLVSELNRHQKFLLTDIKVNGLSYKVDKATPYIEGLTLKHNENNIEFFLTDIPDNGNVSPKYAYNIKGNGNQWLPLDPNRIITVNGLPYGDYELVVCSVDGLGNRLEQVFSMPFTISAPWYFSIWAKIGYLILITLLIWGIRHFYHVRRRLREEEDRRRKILEQQEMRSRFFRNLSLEIKKMLAHIIVPAEKVLSSNPSNELKNLTEDIRYSATKINALIRQAFDLNNPKNSIANLHIASIDVVRFCRGFIHVFEEKHPEFNYIKYSFQSETAELRKKILIVRFDSVFNILINYLSRHIQHGGNVQLNLKQTADKLLIEVKASPLTTDVISADKLFDRYNQIADSPTDIDNSELYLAREYVISMNGEIAVSFNEDQKILSFRITLPMDSNEQSNAEQTEQSIDKVSNVQTPTKKKAKTVNDKDNEEFLQVITSTIEKHITDFDFNVSMLQFELSIGEKTLYRRVKQLTGLTPVEYIRHIRMNRAALLLKEGNFTVSEVMYMVGFSNSGYFSKCFQAVYEITPTKYKQKWKQPTSNQDGELKR